MNRLPPPQVLGCYFDVGFIPPIAVMELTWPELLGTQESSYGLPSGEILVSKLPRRFGVRIHRQAQDAYAVTLVWDSTYRQWFSLRRTAVLESALAPLLSALGTRLDYLLDQPLQLTAQVA